MLKLAVQVVDRLQVSFSLFCRKALQRYAPTYVVGTIRTLQKFFSKVVRN